MREKLNKIRSLVRETEPLIHCITNPISINQCANGVLAVGARPVMAEHPSEVAEITETAKALMLNIGNITDARMESIPISAKTANKKGIPFMIDAVGIACSQHRRRFARSIIDNMHPDLIKGNYSEITALCNREYKSEGVDADKKVPFETVERAAIELAKKYSCVILASGKTDIVTDGKRVVRINNGTPMLSRVTGTGCLLGALCACYMSVCNDMDAAVCACVVLGICGELAETDKGTGSFAVGLMDKLSLLKDEELSGRIKTEEKSIEGI